MSEYFLGSAAAEGFRSDFKRLIAAEGVFTCILKGGAGTGKSSLMKKIAARFEKNGADLYFCSSDPDSLDAVYVKDAKALVVDGTSPHTFDPDFPAVKQKILNLGEFWNVELLKSHTAEIIGATLNHREHMDRARAYITAAGSLCDNTYAVAEESLMREKTEELAEKTADKLLPSKDKDGGVELSLLAAVSPKGYFTRTATLDECGKVFLLTDEYFCAADVFLKKLCSCAADRGYNVTVGKCNLFTQSVYEFVVIKEAGVAFAAATPVNGLSKYEGIKLNLQKYYSGANDKKPRLRMNKSACTKLLDEAVRTLQQAKSIHDDLEEYYIGAMDFDRVNASAESLILEISKRLSVENDNG